MTNHTPTPWRKTGAYIFPEHGAGSVPIARMVTMSGKNDAENKIMEDIRDANADFIVRAVNSYEELIQKRKK